MHGFVQVIIDDSTSKVITGTYEFDRDNGGIFVGGAGSSFPGTTYAGEWFWRTDESKLYRRNSGDSAWEAVAADLVSHSETHENGGTDEITVSGLSGLLADPQTPLSHTHTESDITDLDHTDTDAIHDNVSAEISVVTEKTSLVNADLLLIEDSEASNTKKRAQIGNLSSADGIGDVKGPSSSTDNAIARFDGTTGKVIQNSNCTIDDNGSITMPGGGSAYFYASDGGTIRRILIPNEGILYIGQDIGDQAFTTVDIEASTSVTQSVAGVDVTSATVDGLDVLGYPVVTHISNEASEAESSTTFNNWINKLDHDTPSLDSDRTYMLTWSFEHGADASEEVWSRIELNGTTVGGDYRYWNRSGAKRYESVAGFYIFTGLSGSQDIDIDYGSDTSGETSYIRQARVAVFMIG